MARKSGMDFAICAAIVCVACGECRLRFGICGCVCHGDLTLSNILFNGNNYYLIDFLDSFIETPLMDIVKLRQDTAYLWSPLMYTGTYDVTRLNIICNKIDRDLDKYFSQYEWYRRYYDMFQLLNFFRILQYAKEEKVVSYLKMALNRILSRV